MKHYNIYHHLTAIVLLAAVFAQTFSKAFVIADYYANTGKYAANCENKMRPQMNCNGKCQMLKKLKEEDNKDQQNPERKSDNKSEVVLSSKSFFATVSLVCAIPVSVPLHSVINAKSTDRSLDIFHPPQS